jgi:hypothetical protein
MGKLWENYGKTLKIRGLKVFKTSLCRLKLP